VTSVRVLYLVGAGHSGSTVLDTLLGNAQGVESVGELAMLTRSGWLGLEHCACGERGDACPFWAAVRRRWVAAGGELAEHARLAARFEGRGAWPRLALGRARGGALGAYGRSTAALYAAIAEEAGARVVVDSSKSPARAWALARNPALEVWLVHLVRDARAVAWSLARPKQRDVEAGVQSDRPGRSVTRTALYWSAVNLQSAWVARRLPPGRVVRLRYEDYARDVEAAFAPLVPALGPDVLAVARRAAAGEALGVGHTIAGNRLRMQGPVRLRLDEEWRARLSPAEHRRVLRVAGPLLRRYGYDTERPRAPAGT